MGKLAIKSHTKDRETYMPLKLKTVLSRHALSQTDLGAAILQMSGRPLDKTAMSLLINWDRWPVQTPRESIMRQAKAWMVAQGIPEAESAQAFELDSPALEAGNPVRPVRPRTARDTESTTYPEHHLEPVMLNPAAKRHFKLTFDPFNIDIQSASDVFRGPDQEYVTECIKEAINETRLFALVGESGSGKSTLWEDYKEQVREEGLGVRIIQPKVVNKLRMTDTGIVDAIIRALDPTAKVRQRAEAMTEQAIELLAQSATTQKNVLLFEEAHDLPIQFLKELKRIHEFKIGRKRLMSIILIGQPELLTSLGKNATGKAREVARRLEIVRLLPLDDEVESYVAKRLEAARRMVGDIFDPNAFNQVRKSLKGVVERDGERTEVSMTYPLLVNNLLVSAMNIAVELGAQKVDAGIVADAYKRGA
jgi:type II secretory pathway predicted ATPase ExeA